ncbi:MAG: hypothetical protein KDK66_04415 [Deltaproteobacteria bacterium]|nr:hypothetical protein [Deltaproteobacteria bacterium]
MTTTLKQQISEAKGLEEKLEILGDYQNKQLLSLEKKPLTTLEELQELSLSLSLIAEEILQSAQSIAEKEMRPRYGLPRIKDNDGQYLPSHLALIGMGKLGAQELNFGSDLDLIFVFEKSGSTQGGEKQVSNQEYFTKLVQRIINYLSLHTRRGKLYEVDTELRPSGQAGALVTPLESWLAYYQKGADFWEHQALLKARLLNPGGSFSKAFEGLFNRLIFLKKFPEDLNTKIYQLRERIEKELAKETNTRWDFKKGYGGLMDIEFAIQYLSLRYGHFYPEIVKRQSMTALEAIKIKNLISQEISEDFKEAYLFYRRLEKTLRWDLNLKDTYIENQSDYIHQVAEKMKLQVEEFRESFKEKRYKVREHYKKILKLEKTSN